MKMVEINWRPTDRQLRQFGVIALVALPLLGWLWSGGNETATWVLLGIGGALAAVGFVVPRAIAPVFVGLSLVTLPIGMIVSELVLLMLFFGLFTPIGLVFKLIGRDALERKFDPAAKTYWQEKRQPASAAEYFRQW